MAGKPRAQPPLGVVTTSELSRAPRKVLERVARGERLIVFRHKRPVATLQPLDGVVVQLESGDRDLYGAPMGGPLQEAAKLSEVQRDLLLDGVRHGRFVPVRLWGRHDFRGMIRSIEDLAFRGLARRTERGWEPTGRGMMLREALLRDAGRPILGIFS